MAEVFVYVYEWRMSIYVFLSVNMDAIVIEECTQGNNVVWYCIWCIKIKTMGCHLNWYHRL